MGLLYTLLPVNVERPASAYPEYRTINERPVLAYDAATPETGYWTVGAPTGFTGPLTAICTYAMASGTSGTVEFEIALEAISDGDTIDTDATTSFATINTGSATVPGTAGYIDQISVALTNDDSIAAGDYVRVRIARDADDGTNDTASGDLYLLRVEIHDAAA